MKHSKITLNIGTGFNDGNSHWAVDHITALVGFKFNFWGQQVELRPNTWTDDNGKEYHEHTAIIVLTTRKHLGLTVDQINQRIESLRIILKQDAIAWTGDNDEVKSGCLVKSDSCKYEFDPKEFETFYNLHK
ncbi:MAG: hypothetical protein ACR2NF_07195 [Pirellulales bacterium]